MSQKNIQSFTHIGKLLYAVKVLWVINKQDIAIIMVIIKKIGMFFLLNSFRLRRFFFCYCLFATNNSFRFFNNFGLVFNSIRRVGFKFLFWWLYFNNFKCFFPYWHWCLHNRLNIVFNILLFRILWIFFRGSFII